MLPLLIFDMFSAAYVKTKKFRQDKILCHRITPFKRSWSVCTYKCR